MMPQVPETWHKSFNQNEIQYIAELLLEMLEFSSKAENLNKAFDLSQAKASQGKNINFGFAIEVAEELDLVYFATNGLKLTLTGYETAFIGDMTEIAKVISMNIVIVEPEDETDSEHATPY